MDAMNEAKKAVLRELISSMRKKMLASGEMPEGEPAADEEGAPEGEAEPALEDDEPLEEEEGDEPAPKKAEAKPGPTITLAAIKKGMAAKAPKGPPLKGKAAVEGLKDMLAKKKG